MDHCLASGPVRCCSLHNSHCALQTHSHIPPPTAFISLTHPAHPPRPLTSPRPLTPPPHPLQAAAKSYKWSVLLLALSATLREGIESVLFLTGVSQGDGIKSIIIPGIVGIILGLGLGMAIFYT